MTAATVTLPVVVGHPSIPDGTFYLRPTPPACPSCGHDGDLSSVPSGDHLVMLQGALTINQGEPGAAARLGGVVERGYMTFTATQQIRFAWCSTIDR